MAYVTPDTSRRRIIALGAVGAVHGVMALAILTGFAGGLIQIHPKDWTKAWNYAPPPEPTATPQPAPAPAPHPRDQTAKQDVIVPTGPAPDPGFHLETGPLFPPGGSDLGGVKLNPLPTDPPAPTFTPRAAQPLGAPGKWVSESDYPAAALRRGDQGATRFELTISPEGRVRDCRIAQSSGSADLDAATCLRLGERARFTPARDEHGDLVAGRYTGVIRWRIPE